MIDVVTDISAPTAIATRLDGGLDLLAVVTDSVEVRVTPTPAQDLRDAFAQPAQMVAIGMGLAYMETVAPNCSEGANHPLR